jgi:hypothetical protein
MEIEQILLPRTNYAASPAAKIFPDEPHDSWYLEWEQMDSYSGMQQVRGINGEPPRVRPVGSNRYHAEPGVYGEYTDVDEKELTTRSGLMAGPYGRPMPTRAMILARQEMLLSRRNRRKEWLEWQLLVYGYFQVLDVKGAVVHTDAYTQQVATAAVAWATVATATPLVDLRNIQLLSRGTSSSFGGSAVGYMNRVTANRLLANTNTADIHGKFVGNRLATPQTLSDFNTVLQGEGLPRLEVYDEGDAVTDGGAWTPYIPDGKVVIVGTRPGGMAPGAYLYTRNANNPGEAAAPYTAVDDNAERNEIPRKIKVHDGHNGGPILRFPGSIVVLNVA